MSELKTRYIDDTYAEYYNTGKHELAQIYLKSEADKVIADKNAKILALDAEVAKQKHHAKLFLDERNYAEARLRHHKYHRCLDMAARCESEEKRLDAIAPLFDNDKECWEYGSGYWNKWHDHWLELAGKFKEAEND